MSAVLAIKRNPSTVRYCFEADAEPGVLPPALGLLARLLALAVIASAFDLALDLSNVGIERVLQEALLLDAQARGEPLARGGEPLALEHRHLVAELVDQGLLERRLALRALQLIVLGGELGHQRHHGLARLRIQGLELLRGDHGR